MVFNDTTTLDGAIQWFERYTGQPTGSVSGNTAKLKEATSYINLGSRRVWHHLFLANYGWKYDDSNYADLPQGTQDLVAGVSKYNLPTTALAIDRVQVMDNSGNYHDLAPVRLNEITGAIDEYEETDGLPNGYRIVGNTIELYPGPAAGNITLSGGLKVYFSRGSSPFVYTDTTKTFGFASEYHDVAVMEGAMEWLYLHKADSNVTTRLEARLEVRRRELKRFEGMKIKPRRQFIGVAQQDNR